MKKLKAQGVEVMGLVCHVSIARQRKNLVETTVQVIIQIYLLPFMIVQGLRLDIGTFFA